MCYFIKTKSLEFENFPAEVPYKLDETNIIEKLSEA